MVAVAGASHRPVLQSLAERVFQRFLAELAAPYLREGTLLATVSGGLPIQRMPS
jgi:hypothetical protein